MKKENKILDEEEEIEEDEEMEPEEEQEEVEEEADDAEPEEVVDFDEEEEPQQPVKEQIVVEEVPVIENIEQTEEEIEAEETLRKEHILNLLLQSELKKQPQSEKKKQIGKKKYNVQSHYNIDKLLKEKEKNYFHINEDKENPELTSDFNTAAKKIQLKMAKEDNEVFKILLSDREKVNSDIRTLSATKREHIDQKVKDFFNKKQQKIEMIAQQMNEDYKTKCTFTPEMTATNTTHKRNLEEFITEQNNFYKTAKEKIDRAIKEKESNVEAERNLAQPQIDANSKKIFAEKNKSDQKTYERLYNQRYNYTKKDILSKEEKTNKKTKNKIDEFIVKKDKKAISQSEVKQIKSIEVYATEKKNRMEQLKQKIISEEIRGRETNVSLSQSNKLFLKNVMKKYRELTGEIFKDLMSQNEITENDVTFNRIDLITLNSLLLKLGFTTPEIDLPLNKENVEVESKNKQNEKKLVCDLWEAMKLPNGTVNVDHLFLFILAVINLYEYYMYSSFKIKNYNANPNIEEKKEKKSKEEEKKEILTMIASDIDSRLGRHTKFGGFDEDNNFLISFQKAKMINKEFHIFYVNFMNSNTIVKKKVYKPKIDPNTNKPSLNKNSEKLYGDYRTKLVQDLNSSKETLNNTVSNDKIKSYTDYVDKLILKKKKQENSYAKIKQELKLKETEGCTFKPKINTSKSQTVRDEVKRWEKLYRIGIEMISSKAAVPKTKIELDLDGKELTYMPNIEKPIVLDDIKDNIYSFDYDTLYKRLKNARSERAIKNSIHERGDFPKEYYEYLNKKNVEKTFVRQRNEEINQNTSAHNIEAREDSLLKEENKETTTNEAGDTQTENKDAIPLLIIDVNIRPGVKKKIFVFDGDTADELAEKFSKEHSLDNETKAKLQILIQSHMSRLLMRIPEEEQSIGEKSTHNYLNEN